MHGCNMENFPAGLTRDSNGNTSTWDNQTKVSKQPETN